MKVKKSVSLDSNLVDELKELAVKLTKEKKVFISTSEILEQLAKLGLIAFKANGSTDLENIERKILYGFNKD